MNGKVRTLTRIILSMVIIGIFSVLYFLWLGNFQEIHAEVVKVRSYCFCKEIPLDGVLLWDEELVLTPVTGEVSYPGGLEPSRVPAGKVVAMVRSGGKEHRIYSSCPGYFVPGLDGREGLWNYGSLWIGSSALPGEGDFTPFRSGMRVNRNTPVGKIISLPQDLRLIGYADVHPALMRDMERGYLDIKTRSMELPWRSRVRVYRQYGHRVKVYLSLPFFPPRMTTSRTVSYSIYTGETFGASIPESALTVREGRSGVFRLKGDRAIFHPVEGVPIPGGRVFVENGLTPGDLILQKGNKAREGRVRFW